MRAQSPVLLTLLLLPSAGQGCRGDASHTGHLKSSAEVVRVAERQRDPGDGEEEEEEEGDGNIGEEELMLDDKN